MARDDHEVRPLSERIKNLAEHAIAISPIIKRFWLPGTIGILLLAAGLWQEIEWLAITGLILAAPIFWCYVVIGIIGPLISLFEKPQEKHWKD